MKPFDKSIPSKNAYLDVVFIPMTLSAYLKNSSRVLYLMLDLASVFFNSIMRA